MEVAVLKRKEVLKKFDAKRADQPERKEVKRKADAKRAVKAERQEAKREVGKLSLIHI